MNAYRFTNATTINPARFAHASSTSGRNPEKNKDPQVAITYRTATSVVVVTTLTYRMLWARIEISTGYAINPQVKIKRQQSTQNHKREHPPSLTFSRLD